MSLAVCLGSAYYYLLKTPTIVTRSAEIQIKDDAQNKIGEFQSFADMGISQQKSNIQNEILNLKSKDLSEEVVKRLALDINYFHEGRFRDIVVYGTEQPVILTLVDITPDSDFSANLTVDKNGLVSLAEITTGGQNVSSQTFSGAFDDTISTPVGKMVISRGPAYSSESTVKLKVNKIPLRAARDSYNARLNVELTNEKSSVIRLSISDESSQRADDFLSAVIGVYNENWLRDRNQIAVSTSNFINERLGVIESELGDVDSDISSYKSEHLIPDVNAAASMYMGQSQSNQQQILDLSNQLQMARYIRTYMANGATDALLPANAGVNNGNISSLISEYNTKLLQRNNIESQSSTQNPLVIQLDEQLQTQRQHILNTIDREIANLETQIKILRDNETVISSRIASAPNQAKDLLSVERQQKVKESLYLFLLQKREENELSQAFTAYNTRIINRPGASGVPPTPNSRNIMLMAFIIGLAIPFAVIYLKTMLNTKVRGRKDLESLTPPLLGEIPLHVVPGRKKSKAEKGKREILVKPRSRNIINEAFRVLRTNTEFSRVNKDDCNVIAITSFNPGSGKSFITMNLATAIAIKGKRVLVVDGDMRHGSLSTYVEHSGDGLSDYLSAGTNDLSSLLVTVDDIPTLQVIPIGTVPPNPTELLESPRLAEMLDTLRPHYDYILIDCPPIEVVADAQIIDQIVDRTIFIVRAGLLERAMLPELDRLYDEKKYKHMAIILNGTRNDQGRYGYSHTYKYGYGYGYGYGYNYGTKGKNKDSK